MSDSLESLKMAMIYLIEAEQSQLSKLCIYLIQCFSLGEAYGKEGLLEKCGDCFRAADKIYKVVPGEKHAFYQQIFLPLFKKYVTIASAVIELSMA